ncbi:hypothetical protein [Rhizobium leguminosarum]|uniref:hypothetical protein n=1 Tax=Rhizobium leguminosarum TaxID=384 RepID=UPI001C9460EB|nr:hypothetical protein [Rhizobium leguminosarum]MBY5667448.1 hypothetical protein [Rhizobium leguminosarum]MBY5709471.1 hypothetical protein [Rhizobium leguminosarum]
MNKTLLLAALLSSSPLLAASAWAAEPVIVTCKFDKLPQMILTFRGGMGASDNTLQIGQSKPVPMSVGSNLMSAEYGTQSFTFSLRLPANVSVSAPGQDTLTYYGDCISTLQPN